MRRRLLLSALLASTLFFSATAQMQIFNSDFELWDNVGSNTEEPQGWNGLRTAQGSLAGSTPQTIARSTQTRPGSTGQYSVRVYTTSTLGINANGNLTTGRVNAGSTTPANSNNYNITLTGNPDFSKVLTDRPDSLVFWARFNPASQSSLARVRAVIHDNYNYRDPSDAASTSHVVAEATLNFPSNNNVWKRISIPFVYSGPATSPQYLLITYTSNMTPGGGSAGDEVFIDDMQLIYNPITTTAGNINPLTYSISATQGANISIPFTKTGIYHPGNIFTAQLSDANGSFASPINLGTLSSTSAGTINGTIPAGTPSGTGYRVRVIATTPYQTANDNGVNITINLAANSIAPTFTQTIPAGTGGISLTVTETSVATSRVWKFSTTPGGPYSNFTPSNTLTTYIPNFANAGTYYVVCESTFGSLTARSNEVTIVVVKNQVSPGGTQSLLIGQMGNTLTVTETPMGTSREWKFSNTPGGPYQSFTVPETGNSFIPVFSSSGQFYVVCESEINGIPVISNEVTFSIGSLNINTGAVSTTLFEFSPSAPNATVEVPFVVSSSFNQGNVFTAQLSNESGSFANATDIGTLTGVDADTILVSIPSNTPAGSGYLIRIIGSDPLVFGSDNGTPLTVDQYNNAIDPINPQNIAFNTPGSPLNVTESQATTSREWRFATTSGGPYASFAAPASGNSFAPVFPSPGTYYVVCASTNIHNDEVISNEVQFTVINGSTLNTGHINGSPFYVSPSAANTFDVTVTGNVLFDPNNVFTVELSDAMGSFTTTTVIGTLNGTSPIGLTGTIPNNTPNGTQYRVRVSSSSPAIIATPNNSDLSVVGYAAQISPIDTQFVSTHSPVTPVSMTSTHPFTSVRWKFRTAFFGDYMPFNPPKIGPVFSNTFVNPNIYQVVAECVNQWNDTLETTQVVFMVTISPAGISENENGGMRAYYSEGSFNADLSFSIFENPLLQITDMTGKILLEKQLNGKNMHTILWQPATGIYLYRIIENDKIATGKIYVH